jgi:hypothetical protein
LISASLGERFGPDRPVAARALSGRGETARDLCADTLESAWRVLVEPWWPRIHQNLEADIAYRSRAFADAGLTAVLVDLHPTLTWTGRVLYIDVASQHRLAVGADGIVLMPGVFGSLGVSYEPPSINYQSRGIASLWSNPAASSEPLARLLGSRRADILLKLEVPATTTGLASRCNLPLSSTSEHLKVLRAAGLVSTYRTGRRLQHGRTPLGTALVQRSS